MLVDEHFGCLKDDMPQKMTNFVSAIEKMMYTSHQLMVFANVHKKLNTRIWRTHVESWDTIVEVGKFISDTKQRRIVEKNSFKINTFSSLPNYTSVRPNVRAYTQTLADFIMHGLS